MSIYGSEINAYKKAFETVSKTKQIVLLYEGALNLLKQTKQAIIDQNYEDRFNKGKKAYEIISNLNIYLDRENGGEIAETLSNWYSSVESLILYVITDKETEKCDIAINCVSKMKEAWVAIDEQITRNEEFERAQSQQLSVAGNAPANQAVLSEVANEAEADIYAPIFAAAGSNSNLSISA
jgi:flagellar protein FliS